MQWISVAFGSKESLKKLHNIKILADDEKSSAIFFVDFSHIFLI